MAWRIKERYRYVNSLDSEPNITLVDRRTDQIDPMGDSDSKVYEANKPTK